MYVSNNESPEDGSTANSRLSCINTPHNGQCPT